MATSKDNPFGDMRKLWLREPLKMQAALWPHVTFYDKQKEIIHSVRDNLETYVPAGNMLGKDFVSGFIVLWYFITHWRPPFDPRLPSGPENIDANWVRIVTTSVTAAHLDVLWAEVNRFIGSAKFPLSAAKGGFLVSNKHLLRHIDEVNLSPDTGSYVKGLVAGVNAEGMQGHHAEFNLLVIDEASGVCEEAYVMGMSWAKRALIIGNPHQCANFFYRGVKEGDLILDG